MAILPTAMTDAMTKLLSSMVPTGSRVVPLVPTNSVLAVGLEEQRARRHRHLAVGDDGLLVGGADEAQVDREGDDGDADPAGSGAG